MKKNQKIKKCPKCGHKVWRYGARCRREKGIMIRRQAYLCPNCNHQFRGEKL